MKDKKMMKKGTDIVFSSFQICILWSEINTIFISFTILLIIFSLYLSVVHSTCFSFWRQWRRGVLFSFVFMCVYVRHFFPYTIAVNVFSLS